MPFIWNLHFFFACFGCLLVYLLLSGWFLQTNFLDVDTLRLFSIFGFQGTFLTEILSVIQNQDFSQSWITGKTSLSKQRFPADTGYTFRCRSIFIGSFPWTFLKGSGSHLLSHAVSSIVSSAASVLTIVFGMGTGVSPKRIATGNLRYQVFFPW